MILLRCTILMASLLWGQNLLAVDAKACHDPGLQTCTEAIGEDVSLECEPGQEEVAACAGGQAGTCTWEAGSAYEVQWRFYHGSPILDQGPAFCAESEGTWSSR